MVEEKKESKIIEIIKIVGLVLFVLFLISAIADASSFLKKYLENQEEKDIYKFMCNNAEIFNFCYYDELNKQWEFEILPKTKKETEKIITPEKVFFTSEKECAKFCYQDFLKMSKGFPEEFLSKEQVEEFQKAYPELQKSFWHKLSNWLKKL